MEIFQTLIVLMFFSALLVGIAQKIHLPYPILLILGGVIIGFVPTPEAISFDPNLIFGIVLPPILYYSAFAISFHEFKKNWKQIFSLALGLVAITTLIIGLLFKFLFPEFSWALAFAFGAIVSPPDAVATTAILRRFSINPRLLAILEGESLINDASALVLYKLAIVAILSGIFSFADASWLFVKIVSGGTIIGVITGYFFQNFSRKFFDPVPAIIFSFTIPYVTYIIAHYFEVSEVLAIVVNGLIGSGVLAKHHSSLRRVLGFTFWDIFIILMNCFVFVLIGLQLRRLVSTLTPHQIGLYVAYSVFITTALIIVRLAWVYSKTAVAYFKALSNPKKCDHCSQILHDGAIIGWSGMRGIVSLTAALALPYASSNGMPLDGRDEVIFIVFVVILITILLPGSTLAYLIRMLKIDHHVDHSVAHHARKRLAKIAQDHIQHLHSVKELSDREFDFLKTYFASQRYVLEISSGHLKKMHSLEQARVKVFRTLRGELLKMWEKQEIDDQLFRQLEHELDVEETHAVRAELK